VSRRHRCSFWRVGSNNTKLKTSPRTICPPDVFSREIPGEPCTRFACSKSSYGIAIGFVLFRLAFVADASPQTRDRIVPSSVPLGEGPDFKSWPKKRRSNAYKPIGLSRNSNRTAIRYSGDLPAVRRASRSPRRTGGGGENRE